MYDNIYKVVNNQYYTIVNIINNSNNKNNKDYLNINLIKFEIYIKILLVDNIRKTYCKQTIKNYINNNKIDIIIILVINLKSKINSNKNNFLPICYCKVAKINN